MKSAGCNAKKVSSGAILLTALSICWAACAPQPAEKVRETSAPKMKMTTAIPPEITTPDSVETRIGTLKFFDGMPDAATVEKACDNLDFPARRGSVYGRHAGCLRVCNSPRGAVSRLSAGTTS
jgi:hypothetical protein